MLYDDTYNGPRFRYLFKYRPPTQGANAPKGWIIWSDNSHPDSTFGTMDYPERLPENTVEQFQMVLVEEVPGEENEG